MLFLSLLFFFGTLTFSESVSSKIFTTCTTSSVNGLSNQLINGLNCLNPGVMSRFDSNGNINLAGSFVFPYLQTPATNALMTAADNAVSTAGSLTVNSALRTLAQQYLLYKWYLNGRCGIGIAASPGNSNHNGGLAIDISGYNTFRTFLQAQNFDDNVPGDPVHFNYLGGVDIKANSTLAFQKLWNLNNPNDTIAEDGSYGPNTESKLGAAPAEGFPLELCGASATTVGDLATAATPSCDTSDVDSLSQQIINQITCYIPDVLTDYTYSSKISLQAGYTYPFLQSDATNDLILALESSSENLIVNSGFRTVAQEYLLDEWRQAGKCGISNSSTPGNSHHNLGTSLSTSQYATFKSILEANNFVQEQTVNFVYQGATSNIKVSVIKAFQRLWNLNNPGDLLTLDGIWGPQTASRMALSPTNGFAITDGCSPPSAPIELEEEDVSGSEIYHLAISLIFILYFLS